MALQDLLDLSNKRQKIGLSEERVKAMIPVARKYIAFWRDYPDIFIDFMAQGTTFELFYYQRVFCVVLYDTNIFMEFFLVLIQNLSYLC